MKLNLPSCRLSKQDRISGFLESVELYVNSKPLNSLVKLFGGEIGTSDFSQKIQYLNDFVSVWDYRKKLANRNEKNERWNITDDEFAKKNADEIFEHCKELGMVMGSTPSQRPHVILPLGGARASNLDRPLYARNVIDGFGYNGIKVVALSGFRPIDEKERRSIDPYAPGAKTEFDAINRGLELAFDLKNDCFDRHFEHENLFLRGCIRQYDAQYNACSVYSVAAPSSSADRRANSRDTFLFFLKTFNVEKGDKLLLVTSQIYVSYQLLKFADLAIEREFDVDCVGYAMDISSPLARSSNFLQEIKSTVNAMYDFYEKYGENK